MILRSFLNKYEDLSKEILRCNGCTNILLHSGQKYEIVKIGLNEEGILCETCIKNNRKLESVIRISSNKDNNQQVVQEIQFNKDNNKAKENSPNKNLYINHNMEQVPSDSLNTSNEDEPEQEKITRTRTRKGVK